MEMSIAAAGFLMGKSCTFKCPLPAPSEIGYKKRDPITMIVAMGWAQPCWNVIIVTVVVRSGMDYQSKLCSSRSFKESSGTRTNHIIHFDPPCICIPPLSKQKEGYKTQYAHIYSNNFFKTKGIHRHCDRVSVLQSTVQLSTSHAKQTYLD